MNSSLENQISVARLADAEELSDLINSAYRGESSKAGWTSEADLLGGQRTDPATLSRILNSTDSVILCLRETGPILGCVFMQIHRDRLPIQVHLGMLTVRPTLQTRGLGKKLLCEAEDYARKWGAEAVTLMVIQVRESLMAWYERRGYKKNGHTKPFPHGDLQFGAPKRDDLYFVIFEKSLKNERNPAPPNDLAESHSGH